MEATVYKGYSDETTVMNVIQNVINRMDAKSINTINDKNRPSGESLLAFAGKGAIKLEDNHIQALHDIKE
jgi:hypothetical protein